MINDEKFNLRLGPISVIGMAINKPKNNGTIINPKGIRILKLSSNVNELTIQDTPLK